jgi:hypothetical protein
MYALETPHWHIDEPSVPILASSDILHTQVTSHNTSLQDTINVVELSVHVLVPCIEPRPLFIM